MRGMADRSMRAKQKRHVFTYQTRVCVTPEQDKMLREYGVRFGRVERTLYGDLQKGEAANRLKAEYLVRFAITARQFNAARIQLQGKIEAIRQLLPLQVANLQTRIGKAKKIVARRTKRKAGLEPAASEAEALGGSGTALGTTGSGAKSRPDSPLLRLQEAVPLPVSSRRKWIPIARRVEAGMERGPVEPVLRTGFKRRDGGLSGLRGHPQPGRQL